MVVVWVDVDMEGFFFFWCGCSGFGWWLVAVMVGGCGGCDMGGWMWWLAVLG